MNMDDTIHKQIVLIVLGILIPFCTALYFAHLYKKRIAGYTGDALGAAVESAELCYLFAALIVTRL
jgi:adenosylcobinamide-GDP ribazoletransferase